MTTCNEFALDDVMSVTAIPLADMPIGAETWRLAPVVPSAGFSPDLSHAITIGTRPATAGGTLIPVIRSTGKAKDDESDGVSGRLHSVTVNCDVDDRDGSVWGSLLLLERNPSHLVLTFRDQRRALVLSSEDTYLCNIERDGAKTSVAFKIQCLMGIQLFV